MNQQLMLAKQLYFPVAENDYHIIAPLFPTSLTHVIFQHVQTRFSEETKVAREARRKKKPHTHGYYEHINLAIQKFGGSKPQNISQLNSERGGKIYLLASLPPLWQDQGLKPPLYITSLFPKKFAARVRPIIIKLRKHLKKYKVWNNKDIRQTRADLVNQICDELINFATKIQQLPASWSNDPKCKLSINQKFWLDPNRAKLDEEWKKLKKAGKWRKEVSNDFARWLNSTLEMKELPHFGDNEHREWKKILNHELNLLRDAL
jgi:CRISPR-associated protein Csy1